MSLELLCFLFLFGGLIVSVFLEWTCLVLDLLKCQIFVLLHKLWTQKNYFHYLFGSLMLATLVNHLFPHYFKLFLLIGNLILFLLQVAIHRYFLMMNCLMKMKIFFQIHFQTIEMILLLLLVVDILFERVVTFGSFLASWSISSLHFFEDRLLLC
jgi:hypothetical protein